MESTSISVFFSHDAQLQKLLHFPLAGCDP